YGIGERGNGLVLCPWPPIEPPFRILLVRLDESHARPTSSFAWMNLTPGPHRPCWGVSRDGSGREEGPGALAPGGGTAGHGLDAGGHRREARRQPAGRAPTPRDRRPPGRGLHRLRGGRGLGRRAPRRRGGHLLFGVRDTAAEAAGREQAQGA